MNERATPITDEALRRALVELAGEPDANALLTEVIRTVDDMPQVRRRPWGTPRWERGALLVAALLATLGIGAAVALNRHAPRSTADAVGACTGAGHHRGLRLRRALHVQRPRR